MRTVTAASLAVVMTVLAGCTSQVIGVASPASPTGATGPAEEDLFEEGVPPLADAEGLVPAQYAVCDLGADILNYLATGDNGGDPGMDQVFADYVGVPEPQARALASDWIEGCNEQQAEQEAAAASSASASSAAAAAEASEAAQNAENRRACEAIGGHYVEPAIWGGACESTVEGNPSGEPFKDCGHAWITFPATEADLNQLVADYSGCF